MDLLMKWDGILLAEQPEHRRLHHEYIIIDPTQ
jgi:hypothetical protein